MDIYARWIWLEYPLRHILRSCRHFSDRPFFIFGKRKKLWLYFTIALFAIVAMKLGHSEAYSNAPNTYLWNSGGSHKKYKGSLYPVQGPENQRIQSLNKYRCCVTSRVSTLTKHREALLLSRPTHLRGFPRLDNCDCRLSHYMSRYLFRIMSLDRSFLWVTSHSDL